MIRKYRSKMGRVAYYVYTTVAGSDRKHYVGKARTVDDAKQLERQAETESWQVKHGLREPDRPETFENLAKPWANARGEAGADGLPRRAAWVDDVSRMNRNLAVHAEDAQPVLGLGLGRVREANRRAREGEHDGRVF